MPPNELLCFKTDGEAKRSEGYTRARLEAAAFWGPDPESSGQAHFNSNVVSVGNQSAFNVISPTSH